MLNQTGIVTAKDSKYFYITVDNTQHCKSCSSSSGCISSKIAQLKQPKPLRIKRNLEYFNIGDSVVLTISIPAFLRAIFIVYCLPILAILGTSLCFFLLIGTSPSDLIVIIAIVLGLVVTSWLQRIDFFNALQCCQPNIQQTINSHNTF